MVLREVVVPFDLSGEPGAVLGVAAAVAGRAGVPVRLLLVGSPGLDHDVDRADLERVAAGLGVPATADVAESNDVVRALLEAAGADSLLCIETSARRPAAAALLGSTTRDLLAAASRPVLLVGPSADPGVPLGVLELGLRDAGAATAVLASCGELARALGLRLRLVHVPDGHDRWPAAGDELAALAERARQEHGVEAEAEILSGGDVADILVADAHSHQASIMAVGVHREPWLRRVANLGSVAQHVAHAAAAAVLAVPTSPH
ncbi:MAG TPA: universal stress protein [Acidimicrobiales bacterium]|nr:universal stress protein [Acidimicrobiales bacterium]